MKPLEIPQIPDWLENLDWVQAFAVIGLLLFIVGLLWKLYPRMKGLGDFLDDWQGRPERFPGDPKASIGVVQTLSEHGELLTRQDEINAAIRQEVAEIRSQVTPNHGSTAKMAEEIQDNHAEARQFHADAMKAISELGKQVADFMKESSEDRKRLWRAIDDLEANDDKVGGTE